MFLSSCSRDKNIEDDLQQNDAKDDSVPIETTYVETFIDTTFEVQTNEAEPVDSFKAEIKVVQKKTVFNTLEYDKVVAYEYEQSGPRGFNEVVHKYSKSKREIPIGIRLNFLSDKNKAKLPVGIKIRGNTIIRNMKNLSMTEINDFDKIVSSLTTYGGVIDECFNPHFAVVCYKDQNPSLIIEVCLECNYLIAFPKPQVLIDIYSELFIKYVNDVSNNSPLFDQKEIISNCSSFHDTTSNCYRLYEEALIRGFNEPEKIDSFIRNIGFSANYENGLKLDKLKY